MIKKRFKGAVAGAVAVGLLATPAIAYAAGTDPIDTIPDPTTGDMSVGWHVEDNNYVNPSVNIVADFIDKASPQPMTRSAQNM